jgi:hypothetical protein
MTKKDYIRFADMLKTLKKEKGMDWDTLIAVQVKLQNILKADNPAFDVDRFTAAAKA